MSELEKRFTVAMKEIYTRADKECGYRATRFLQMLSEYGAVQTAINLVSKHGGTEGFAKLWELGRLDLSVEALVLKSEFQSLFTNETRGICRDRLKEYGYFPEETSGGIN